MLEVASSRITDSGVEILSKVPSLRQLDLDDTTVSSVAINFLKGRRLQNLCLRNTRVDNQCVDALASLQGLRVLLLGGTKLSAKSCWLLVRSGAEVLDLSRTGADDSSLAKIYNPHLETLFLNDTKITDDGLASLRACPTLRSLFVENTKVTEEGVRKLQASNRKLSIVWRSEPEEGFLDIKREEPPIRINKL